MSCCLQGATRSKLLVESGGAIISPQEVLHGSGKIGVDHVFDLIELRKLLVPGSEEYTRLESRLMEDYESGVRYRKLDVLLKRSCASNIEVDEFMAYLDSGEYLLTPLPRHTGISATSGDASASGGTSVTAVRPAARLCFPFTKNPISWSRFLLFCRATQAFQMFRCPWQGEAAMATLSPPTLLVVGATFQVPAWYGRGCPSLCSMVFCRNALSSLH